MYAVIETGKAVPRVPRRYHKVERINAPKGGGRFPRVLLVAADKRSPLANRSFRRRRQGRVLNRKAKNYGLQVQEQIQASRKTMGHRHLFLSQIESIAFSLEMTEIKSFRKGDPLRTGNSGPYGLCRKRQRHRLRGPVDLGTDLGDGPYGDSGYGDGLVKG